MHLPDSKIQVVRLESMNWEKGQFGTIEGWYCKIPDIEMATWGQMPSILCNTYTVCKSQGSELEATQGITVSYSTPLRVWIYRDPLNEKWPSGLLIYKKRN